ncbi:F-box only protein 39-like [Centroberyx gerrardi]|uniref:F-box only protein 39-like n=1 Tax=Centroberyx gerrardi TaxID=166262 RepID=UPI003AAB8B28
MDREDHNAMPGMGGEKEEREKREDEVEEQTKEEDTNHIDYYLERAAGWGSLPDVCLRHVFRWLRNRDRMSADLVCRHWHSVMCSPSLWRSRCFHLSGRLSKHRLSEHSSTMAYALSLGSYLERLEVCVCPSPRSSMVAQRLQRTITDLFDELTRAKVQLRSLSLAGLQLDRRCWTWGLKNSLVHSLTLFLRQGASRLTSVRLRRMRTSLPQGLELLSTLSLSQRHFNPCISSLDLEEFFLSSLSVHLNPIMPHILHNLRSLTSLSLSYSCLSDALLLALGSKAPEWRNQWDEDTLQTFSLQCLSSEPHGQVVRGSSWASLASSCPDLKVKLKVVHVVNTDRLARILLPEIPLTEYTMTACYSSDEDWSAKPVLTEMLPQYRHSLQNLTLDLSNCNEALDEELLDLVEVCVCLERLRVWAFLEISTVDRLLQNRLNQRSRLNDIRVGIYSLNEDTDEDDQVEELMSCYQHLPPELNFSVIVYPFI